jgi:chromosome partitioning protein
MRSIAVVNQKGGCGKTITAINVAACLADHQKRVLLIDMDPQGHALLGLQSEPAHPAQTITEVLLREANGHSLGLRDVRRTVLPGLDMVPSDILLSSVPERLSGVPGRENRLAEAIDDIRDEYDYLIVDCPPNVGLLTFNALLACSEAIVPVEPSLFSLHGIVKLFETIDLVARKAGHDIAARAVITLYTGRSPFVKELAADIRSQLGDRIFQTVVRFSIKLAEAASHGTPISHYSKRSTGFDDYRALTLEILEQEARFAIPAPPEEATETTEPARPSEGVVAPPVAAAGQDASSIAQPETTPGEAVGVEAAADPAATEQAAVTEPETAPAEVHEFSLPSIGEEVRAAAEPDVAPDATQDFSLPAVAEEAAAQAEHEKTFDEILEFAISPGAAEEEAPARTEPTITLDDIPEFAPLPPAGPIVFMLTAPGAQHVQLAGDFNAWNPGASEMEFCDGVWKTTVNLAPGRYRYRYVVDGRWQSDPLNPTVEPSPFGDYDSVIVLVRDVAGV